MTAFTSKPVPASRAIESFVAAVRRFFTEAPSDIQTEYLRHLFKNSLITSVAASFSAIYTYNSARQLPPTDVLFPWLVAYVVFHSLRALSAVVYARRTDMSPQELRMWSVVAMLGLALDSGLVVFLTLHVYPLMQMDEQLLVVMIVLVIVGSTAYSLSGRWIEILIYATPMYAAFAWTLWPLDFYYARVVAVLIGVFYALYLLHARNQHRTKVQSFALTRRNGELAAELQVKNEELQEVATARSRLLATVSHDLRQPSHAIGLLCERALLEANPTAVKDALYDLNELSQSLGASLTTLMDLTRLDAGLVKANLGPAPLKQVMLRLEAEFAGSARNKGLVFSVNSPPLWVHTDPVLLHGIVANLVSNAIKYTRQGRVAVECEAQGEEVLISVKDTGMGIKPEKFEQMFKEFVRLEGAESGTEGLGLGLSIVRRYAALLGHALSVESEPQQGSCFSIRLPRLSLQSERAAAKLVSRPLAQGDERLSGLCVLVVDNVDLVLSSMVRTLRAWGCEVHAGRSLAEARSVALQHRLDLVISDFHLGDDEPDGLMLIRALRGLEGRGMDALPALLMTGDVSARLESDARQSRVGILHKPVRPAVLQGKLLDQLHASAWPVNGGGPEVLPGSELAKPLDLQDGAAP